jgi:hypothetical protein
VHASKQARHLASPHDTTSCATTVTTHTQQQHRHHHQEPRDGRFWCEADGGFVDHSEWRYLLSARVADATRETYVNLFNDQV